MKLSDRQQHALKAAELIADLNSAKPKPLSVDQMAQIVFIAMGAEGEACAKLAEDHYMFDGRDVAKIIRERSDIE